MSHKPPPIFQITLKDDRETQEKLEQLEKRVEQQRRKIEELQARKQQEYEPGEDMIPERHEESDGDEQQQLPLKRVFVKRNKSIYDEEREYSDDKAQQHQQHQLQQDDVDDSESAVIVGSSHEEMAVLKGAAGTAVNIVKASSLDDAKIIIIKPEDNPGDVDEMSRELCNILESTDNVVKMQESVLNNLTQITTIDESVASHKTYATIASEATGQEGEVPTSTMVDEPMEQEIITGEMEPDMESEMQEQVSRSFTRNYFLDKF